MPLSRDNALPYERMAEEPMAGPPPMAEGGDDIDQVLIAKVTALPPQAKMALLQVLDKMSMPGQGAMPPAAAPSGLDSAIGARVGGM